MTQVAMHIAIQTLWSLVCKQTILIKRLSLVGEVSEVIESTYET
jgi:hypothetical protein